MSMWTAAETNETPKIFDVTRKMTGELLNSSLLCNNKTCALIFHFYH